MTDTSANPQLVLRPRTQGISDLIEAHLEKQISFGELCSKVAAMGFKTTSLYEMVIAAEAERRQ